jgi:flagellar biosynthesis chaperone FliJ
MHAASALHEMRDAQRLVIELAGVHRRLEAARVALGTAVRQRQAIEALRERRYRAWLRRRDRAETMALDELAVMRRSHQQEDSW